MATFNPKVRLNLDVFGLLRGCFQVFTCWNQRGIDLHIVVLRGVLKIFLSISFGGDH